MAISVLYFFSLIAGLAFQTYIAYVYGIAHGVDIFIFSSGLVLFFTASFSTGLTGSFVPLFTEKQHRSTAAAWEFSFRTLISTFALTLLFAAVLAMFAKPLLYLVTNDKGGRITAEDVLLLRWQSLSIPFVILSQVLILILNCLSRYIVSTFSTLLNAAGILFFSYSLSSFGIGSLGMGIFIASTVQCAYLFWLYLQELPRAGVRLTVSPAKDETWAMFKRVGVLAGMFMLFKGSDIFDRYLSLSLGTGYTAYIGYSYRILVAGGTLLGVGLLTTSYPEISKAVARKDPTTVRLIVRRVIILLFLFLAPLSFWVFGVGDIMISVLFQHGKFGAADTKMVFDTMKAQIGLFLFPALGSFFTNILYAYRQVRMVVYLGIFTTALNVTLKIFFLKLFGYFGLVLSVTLCYSLDALLLFRAAGLPIGGFSLGKMSRDRVLFLFFVVVTTALSLAAGQFVPSAFVRIFLLCIATIAYVALVFRSGLLPEGVYSRIQTFRTWIESK